jgi:DNA-binding HxlR family transcriptional regulator
MDLQAAEAGVLRISEGEREFVRQTGEVLHGNPPRRSRSTEGQAASGAMRENVRPAYPLLGCAPRRFAVGLQRDVRHSADVPNLQEDRPALAVDLVGDQAPALDLRVRVDAGRPRISPAAGGDVGCLGHHEPGTRALSVVFCHQGIRDTTARRPCPGHRRHGDAAFQDALAAKVVRVEQPSHRCLLHHRICDLDLFESTHQLVRMTRITKRLPGLPIERTLGVISGRWKAVIIFVLLDGPKRICELEQQISGISQKVLIQQLRSLEEHGLLGRRAFAEEPQRVVYALTPLGLSLKPLISQLYEWGLHHAEERRETHNLLPCEAIVRGAVSGGD